MSILDIIQARLSQAHRDHDQTAIENARTDMRDYLDARHDAILRDVPFDGITREDIAKAKAFSDMIQHNNERNWLRRHNIPSDDYTGTGWEDL